MITSSPLTQAIIPGNTVSIDVDYSTLDDGGQPANEQATALGLRLHYNSSVLTYDNLSNLFTTGLTATQDLPDTSDFDGDTNTDRYINAGWFDFGGNWPGTGNPQPIDLYTANFTTDAGFTGTTTLNYTRSTTPAGFPDFVSDNPQITEFVIPDISISDAADVTEGGTSIFTVTLDRAPSGVVTIDYATSHNTTDDSDYTASAGQLTFNPGGALTQTIGVVTTQDGTVEPDESFFVDLSGAVNGNITDNQGQALILNDDVPTVSVADAGSVNEGSDAVFTVSLDQNPLSDVTVTVSTLDGSALAPSDYTGVSGQVLTFSPGGALTQQVTISTIDDATPETDEEFTLEIDSLVGGTEDPANGSGIATIAANDPPTISIADAGNVAEAGIATFIVSLDQAPAVTLTIDYAASGGSATLTDDFDVTSGTLTFTPTGALTQGITVQTVQDGLVEQDETFFVDLSNPMNVVLGTAQGQATILDDDVPAISVSDAVSVAEGADSIFTVSLDQNPVSPVTVTISTSNGSAIDPDDFFGGAIDLTFNPGDFLSYTPNVDLAPGPVRWWIRASDAIGNRGWSELGRTGIRTDITSPTGSTGNATPTITWDSVEGAGRYILHVLNLDTNMVEIREDNLTGTSFTPPNALSGNYRAWVKAIDGATNLFSSGRWSPAVDFTVAESSSRDSHSKDANLIMLSSLQLSPEASDLPENVNTPETFADNADVEESDIDMPPAMEDKDLRVVTQASDEELNLLDHWMADPLQMAVLSAE